MEKIVTPYRFIYLGGVILTGTGITEYFFNHASIFYLIYMTIGGIIVIGAGILLKKNKGFGMLKDLPHQKKK